MTLTANASPSERDLAAQVAQLAKLFGWHRYHTWRSIRSPAGFPDEVLVRGDRLIIAELKSEGAKLKPKQREWLEALGEPRRDRENPPVSSTRKGRSSRDASSTFAPR